MHRSQWHRYDDLHKTDVQESEKYILTLFQKSGTFPAMAFFLTGIIPPHQLQSNPYIL